MPGSFRTDWLAWGMSAALGALALVSMLGVNSLTLTTGALEAFEGEVHLPSASSARRMSFGFVQLMADYYWLSAVQYFGTRENRFRDYRDLPKYLELVQELSPRFCYPYVFAGEAVPYHRPDGQWANTAAAMALLEPGLDACPDEWRIPFQLAWSQFTFTDRYGAAADNISRASQLPGAPTYLSSLATRLYGQQGDLETALVFAQTRLAVASDPYSRAELMKRILQIELEVDLKRLAAAAQSFAASHDRPLKDLAELRDAGILPEIPADPLGGNFFVQTDGSVASHHENELLRLHVGKGLHLREPVVN